MISNDEIKSLARLAKLSFDEQNLGDFAESFREIIEFADRINAEIDGGNAEIREVGGEKIALAELRSDEVKESFSVEKITSNVRSENGYFKVRRVVK